MRSRTSIPVKLLGAAGAALLVCGMAWAQQTGTKTAISTRDRSHARFVRVASTSHSSTSSSPSSTSTSRKGKKSRKRVSSRQRGQQKIDASRTREIQEALIREHYLDGPPSGVWDAKSQSAMERLQAENGWQSKVVPDSRALIKLGLGPDHEHLLNPESAMTSMPLSNRAAPQAETSHASPMLNQIPAMAIPPQK